MTIDYNIDLQPLGRRIKIKSGQNLLEAAQESGAGLVSICGGEGICNGCIVKIISGGSNEPTNNETSMLTDEELSSGIRMACQVVPESDMVVNIPSDSLTTPQRLQVEGQEIQVELDPIIEFADLIISPPTIEDLLSDTERIAKALREKGNKRIKFNFPLLSSMSNTLREFDWKFRVAIRKNEVIAILPHQKEIFGIAVDIGTTKVAIYLLSLESGKVIDKIGEMNPQIAYGEDVISRIAYANQSEKNRQLLSDLLIETMNKKINELCKKNDLVTEQIMDAVVVGNTAIHHLFAGLPVKQLGYAPYVPAVSRAMDIPASKLGLEISTSAYIHLLPNIAGYVGADHIAVILASKLTETKKAVMAVDIGTNTEISLAANGKLLSCSCASGPAFEGAHIKDGMRAAPGAIERIKIESDGAINIFTIEDQAPIGICGSGIVDAAAELLNINAINSRGAFTGDHPNIRKDGKNKQEFLLVSADDTGHGKDISVTRSDINEIQLAKGAIRMGIDILLSKAGISAQEVDHVIVAGAFGTYINIKNAIKIGMFPEIRLDKFEQVGNSAGMGAKLALLSKEQRKATHDISKKIGYVELTTYPDFQKKFIKSMMF